MEVSFPHEFANRCLTPEMVLLQLKYRYVCSNVLGAVICVTVCFLVCHYYKISTSILHSLLSRMVVLLNLDVAELKHSVCYLQKCRKHLLCYSGAVLNYYLMI